MAERRSIFQSAIKAVRTALPGPIMAGSALRKEAAIQEQQQDLVRAGNIEEALLLGLRESPFTGFGGGGITGTTKNIGLRLSAKKGNEKIYDIIDDAGKEAGVLFFERQGKTGFIDSIFSSGSVNQKVGEIFGTSGIRKLLRQIIKDNPDIETISGERLTGARMRTSRTGLVTQRIVPTDG